MTGKKKPAAKPVKNAVVKADPKKTVKYWVGEISETWQGAVDSILATGELLIEAKASVAHGSWTKLLDELPFTDTTAQRLMKIASDKRLTKPAHVQALPPAWGTLYELTKLDDKTFKSAMDKGIINPEMERADVEALLGKSKKPKIDKEAEDAEEVEVINGDEPDDEDDREEYLGKSDDGDDDDGPAPKSKSKGDTPNKAPRLNRQDQLIDFFGEAIYTCLTRLEEFEGKIDDDDALGDALRGKFGRDILKDADVLSRNLARLVKAHLKGS